jgi:hypothetical protein
MPKRKHKRRMRGGCAACPEGRSSVGLPITFPLGIPTYWTAEEALAVFELIDELRDKIVDYYHPKLQELMRKDRQSAPLETINLDDDDLPF